MMTSELLSNGRIGSGWLSLAIQVQLYPHPHPHPHRNNTRLLLSAISSQEPKIHILQCSNSFGLDERTETPQSRMQKRVMRRKNPLHAVLAVEFQQQWGE